MYTIAVIDDDVYIGDMIEEVLRKEGYAVLRAYSGTEALLLLGKEAPDLILLDLMLPGLSGEEVLAALRGRKAPVIVISAKVGVEDKVSVLLDGAADYLTKPFEIKELLARITVQLRQVQEAALTGAGNAGNAGEDAAAKESGNMTGQSEINDMNEMHRESLNYGNLTLDTAARKACVGETAVHLTRTEYAILKYLMLNPGQVLTKTQILERISEDTPDCMESSLKVHISNLRKKLQAADGRDYIESVWGIGFKLGE